jgi:hypothetical protein
MYSYPAKIACEGKDVYLLVIFYGQIEGGDIDVASHLEITLRDSDQPDEIVFIYPSYLEGHVEELFRVGTRSRSNITRYRDEVPVAFLSFDVLGTLTQGAVIGESQFVESVHECQEELVACGAEQLVDLRLDSIVLHAPPGTIFRKPSGDLYDKFIKAGELTVSGSQNSFLAFCLLRRAPSNREIKRILLDTASICVYVECLVHYWSMFRGEKCKSVTYTSFGSYHGLEEASPPDDVSTAWVIVSASASNNMGVRIARDWGLEDDQVITLLSLSEPKPDRIGDSVLLNIAQKVVSPSSEKSESNLIQVEVVGENFTAKIESPNSVDIGVRHKSEIGSSLVFSQRENPIFHCNRTSPASAELLPVSIDCTGGYFSTKPFRDWLERELAWHVPTNARWLVFRGSDPASISLATKIEEVLSSLGLGEIEKTELKDARTAITGNESLIVAMPVTTTGETLLRLNRNLRISKHSGQRIFVSPFVLFKSEKSFDHFHSSVTYAPNKLKYCFLSQHKLFVGHHGVKSSWEHELEIAEQCASPYWKFRAARLRNYGNGLEGKIGLHPVDADIGLAFSKDFAFWGRAEYQASAVRPEAAYITISTILQGLRDAELPRVNGESLQRHVYQNSVISPESFSRFNDPLLQSSLWRSAYAHELEYSATPELSHTFTDFLLNLIEEMAAGEANAALDLVMGLCVRRITLGTEDRQQIAAHLHTHCGSMAHIIELANYLQNDWRFDVDRDSALTI